MRFASPWALLLLLPLAWAVRVHLRRGGENIPFSSLETVRELPRTWRRRWRFFPFFLRTAAAALLIVALARPQAKSSEPGLPREGVAIELVVDISSSMDIAMSFRDRSLSRLEITRRVVEEFVRNRPDDLIGLITFARYADTVCPLTLSHDTLLYFIRELHIESRPNEDGTAFGDALALAAARLRTAEERYGKKDSAYAVKSKVIILLTDGNNNCGRHLPLEGAALAKKWGIRVHTIAITDPPEEKTVQTPAGPVKVPAEPLLQEAVLRKIAEMTGGTYHRATDEASLREIYRQIDRMEKSPVSSARRVVWRERFPPFAAAAAGALFLSALLSATWLRTAP